MSEHKPWCEYDPYQECCACERRHQERVPEDPMRRTDDYARRYVRALGGDLDEAERPMTSEREPVAWLVDIEDDYPHATMDRDDAERDAEHARAHTGKPTTVRPLYSHETVEALEAEVARLRAEGDEAVTAWAENERLRAEIERLREALWETTDDE